MPQIKFTPNLKQFFPGLTELRVEGSTVSAVIDAINIRWPGIADYILDEQGRVRKHVNIFIDGEMIEDRITLSDPLAESTQVYIFQALSGG